MITLQTMAARVPKLQVCRQAALVPLALVILVCLTHLFPTSKAVAQSQGDRPSISQPTSSYGRQYIALRKEVPSLIDANAISAFLDPSRSMSIHDVLDRDNSIFVSLPYDRIDFDYTRSKIWLRIPIRNSSELAIEPIMVLHARFMHHLEAFRVDGPGAQPVSILTNSASQPFNDREIAYRHLATPVPLEGGESTVIYIGYWSDGASEMPVSFETPASFERLRGNADTFNATIYAACFAMIAFTLMATAVMRWRVHVAYSLYFGWVVLYLAHMEGYTFQYLWPDWPNFNAYASLLLGYGLSFFAILFTREFLKLRNHAPLLDNIGIAILIGTVLVVALGSFGDTLFIKRFGFVFVFATSVFLVACGLVSIRHKQPGAVYYLIGWSAISIATFLSTVTHWSDDYFALSMTNSFISAAVLFEAVIFTLAINAQVHFLREDKEAAMKARLAASEENLQLERERADALAQAEARRTQLATASHDAKQPLMALRLALEGETGRGEKGDRLREILSYLDSLIARQLDQSHPDSAIDRSDDISSHVCDTDAMVSRLEAMFRIEAETKGLRFVAKTVSATCACDPMPILRILSNLVANAIQHTDKGHVGIIATVDGPSAHFEVFDSGRGMTADQLENAKKAYSKGAASGGHGLGLMIAYEIAEAYGLHLAARQRPRGGMRFTLSVPVS